MKKLIVPFIIIIGLIVSFIIIDRAEFDRYDGVRTVQTEKSVNSNPSTSEPESESATTGEAACEEKAEIETPLVENPSEMAEPVVEAMPAANEMPTEAELTTDPTPGKEEKSVSAPEAVPVVTAEEALNLNEEAVKNAMAEKERKEPFFRFYENSILDLVGFEGTVRATSPIPDPEKNDYDNCLYAVFIELESFFIEDKPGDEMPCEVILAVPIMKDKTVNKDNIFIPGDKISCKCAEYDAMPQVIQEIQLSDSIQSFEHQQYYALNIEKINVFTRNGSRNFAKREITILPIQTLPKDKTAADARASRIRNEIKRVEDELGKHGGSFESWREEYKAIDSKYKALCAEERKGWINDSYYYARGKETSDYKTKGFIEGILPYKKYLEENNIDLVLMRFPSRSDFAARVFGSEEFQENPAWVEHYYECLKNDIEIVDPMPEMWEHRFDYPMFYFYNLPDEQHPLEGEIMTAAEKLSKVLGRYDIPREDDPIALSKTSYKSPDVQFLWPAGDAQYDPEENITFDQAVQNDTSIGTLQLNSSHPVIILSNSFLGGFPFRTLGASVPAYLSYFLQSRPDWLYQSGIGNAMIRNLISSPELLANRQVVVMGIGYNMWNEVFPPFPKYISDKAGSISLEKTMDFRSGEISVPNPSNGNPFVCSIDENGSARVIQAPENNAANKAFEISLSIPEMSDRNTCMLRCNFGEDSNKIAITVYESGNGQSLDTAIWHSENSLHTDLFIPVSDGSRKVSVQFKPNYPNRFFTIKNLELWYY